MKKTFVILPFLILGAGNVSQALIINVPADRPTIQAAIDTALVGDTVLVAPGIYYENIVSRNYGIALASQYIMCHEDSMIFNTVIDGSSNGTVIVVSNTIGLGTIIEGFTIQNGQSGDMAGGIQVYGFGTVATIRNNRIMYNYTTQLGGGIAGSDGADVTVCYNFIAYNRSSNLNGGGLSAYRCDFVAYNNVIKNNFAKL